MSRGSEHAFRARSGTVRRVWASLIALLVVVGSVLTGTGTAHADTVTDPLTLTIDSMTPSTSSGDIQLTGHITNADDQTWRNINILPFLSATPIQTVSGLTQAMQTPDNVDVGHRIQTVFTVVKELSAGATTTWSLTVPNTVLPHIRGGVYWFGVHALGTSDAGVSANANGRARTFLPVVGATNSPARVHVIVEFTEQISYDSDGHLLPTTSDQPGAPTWAHEFSQHLARLLSVVNHTPGADLLVDPAVVDAAIALADGNTGWLGTAASLSDTKAAAQAWLTSFKAVGATHQVWALPYGDIDLTATADRPDIATTAERVAMAPFRALGVRAAPARRSPDLSASGAVVAGPSNSTAFVDAQIAGPVSTTAGVRVVGTALASYGAPKPGAPYADIPLRQQILGEAALHVGSTAPVVVIIPSTFSPADPAGFAYGLAAPWVSLEPLPQALSGLQEAPFPAQHPANPESPLVRFSVNSYDAAVADASSLAALTGQDVTTPVTRSALTGLSRDAIHGSSTSAMAEALGQLVGSIRITAPPAVTLSGSSGRFLVTVENRLPIPVTVGIKTIADLDTSTSHIGNLTLAAHAVGSQLATVSINTHGTHRVSFSVTDPTGRPTGVTVTVAVRSVQVSGVIWGFIAGGVGLLGLAIAMRLVRRVRSHV